MQLDLFFTIEYLTESLGPPTSPDYLHTIKWYSKANDLLLHLRIPTGELVLYKYCVVSDIFQSAGLITNPTPDKIKTLLPWLLNAT